MEQLIGLSLLIGISLGRFGLIGGLSLLLGPGREEDLR
jgi:hypothetical protein